jgi:hypothetical protein
MVVSGGTGEILEQICFQFVPSSIDASQVMTVSFQLAMCILYNQRDATYTMFLIIISAVHVSGGFFAHHQELIKVYVQPWILSCFPAVYRWCGWVVPINVEKIARSQYA